MLLGCAHKSLKNLLPADADKMRKKAIARMTIGLALLVIFGLIQLDPVQSLNGWHAFGAGFGQGVLIGFGLGMVVWSTALFIRTHQLQKRLNVSAA